MSRRDRRAKILRRLPALRDMAAEMFAAGEGSDRRIIPGTVRAKLHAQGVKFGFSMTEWLIIIQILALLWQLWQSQKAKDPQFSPVGNLSVDADVAAAYDEIDLDKD